MIYSGGEKVLMLMISGIMLTIIFTSIAFLVSLSISDKVKGMGTVLFLWLYFTLIYDGIMLLFVRAMTDYPVEQYTLLLTMLNPVDMCRILIMFSMDISVLMGLTGAVLQEYIGTFTGKMLIYGTLLLWAVIPVLWSSRIFNRKDF
jgi:Cu-processing system permease protein